MKNKELKFDIATKEVYDFAILISALQGQSVNYSLYQEGTLVFVNISS